ncbi:hypothetical protein MNBD_GAMMA13-635 [hydrothermal vent metagenome]|uniref:Uncharacterized protein n=1 Tax=hydrothermal vent metagenome TaxID=652676 RepID=A0A3B0YJL1_9ZZZZ
MSWQQTAKVIYLRLTSDEHIDGRDIMTTKLSHKIGLVLHIDETLEASQREDIEQVINAEKGIGSARFTERRPHLMVVEYDPELISSTRVLASIHHQSVCAQLVGPI